MTQIKTEGEALPEEDSEDKTLFCKKTRLSQKDAEKMRLILDVALYLEISAPQAKTVVEAMECGLFSMAL